MLIDAAVHDAERDGARWRFVFSVRSLDLRVVSHVG
jgi:hypothetical protein